MPFFPFFCPYMNQNQENDEELDDFRSPHGGPHGVPFNPPGQGPGFGPPFGPPGQGPGFAPPFGGQSGPPSGPPPSVTPKLQSTAGPGGPSVMAVDPGAIRPCRYQFVYIWPKYGRPFWAWLTFVGPRSAAGYRWTGYRWRYFGIDLRQIESFQCY